MLCAPSRLLRCKKRTDALPGVLSPWLTFLYSQSEPAFEALTSQLYMLRAFPPQRSRRRAKPFQVVFVRRSAVGYTIDERTDSVLLCHVEGNLDREGIRVVAVLRHLRSGFFSLRGSGAGLAGKGGRRLCGLGAWLRVGDVNVGSGESPMKPTEPSQALRRQAQASAVRNKTDPLPIISRKGRQENLHILQCHLPEGLPGRFGRGNLLT